MLFPVQRAFPRQSLRERLIRRKPQFFLASAFSFPRPSLNCPKVRWPISGARMAVIKVRWGKPSSLIVARSPTLPSGSKLGGSLSKKVLCSSILFLSFSDHSGPEQFLFGEAGLYRSSSQLLHLLFLHQGQLLQSPGATQVPVL